MQIFTNHFESFNSSLYIDIVQLDFDNLQHFEDVSIQKRRVQILVTVYYGCPLEDF